MTTLKITAEITVVIVDDQPTGPTSPVARTTPRAEPAVRDLLRQRALRGLLPADPATGCRKHRIQHKVIQMGGYRARLTGLLWEAQHTRPLPEGNFVWRTCATQDCREPTHLTAGSRQQMDEWRNRAWHIV